MRNEALSGPVRRPWLRTLSALGAVLVAVLVLACESPSGSARPSASLVELEFTARPSVEATGSPDSATAEPTAASWPVGWDVAFCTSFTDAIVVHELVIDIERALEEDEREDAQALAGELTQVVPIARAGIERMRDWEPAATVKTDLLALMDLDAQVGATYQTWFVEGGRPLLRDARRLRNEVGRALPTINENLQALADLGLSCPGVGLELETF